MSGTVSSEGRKANGFAGGHAVPEKKDASRKKDDALLVSQEILRLVDASKEGRLAERGRVSEFTGVYREMVEGINEMLDAILLPIGEGNRILAQISGGKIDELIAQTYKGDHEKMKVAVNNMGSVIQSLHKEFDRLTDASRDGQLSERGKPEQFQGAYAEIVRGVNAMLDAILLPIGEGNRILGQISSGKIDELIAQTYKGDHEKMKVAVNNVALVTQSLQKELGRLIDASKEGQLSERGKPEQFQGAYAEIVRGMNAMLDAILLPIGEGNRILGADLQRQDRRADCADLQGRPREDEGRRQQRGAGYPEPAERAGASDRRVERRTALRARQARAVPGCVCGDRARHECHAGCHSAANRRGESHSGADFQGQDR